MDPRSEQREGSHRGILLGLLAAGLLLRLALAWAPYSYLASRGPLVDDAFYSFSIARNLALGLGPTADGIHPTSGFQPLYTFLLVPFYLLFPRDPILPIHLALAVLAIAGTATGWLIFRIVSRIASGPAALFSLALWTFSPYFLSQGLNGLETGLLGLGVAATLDWYLERIREEPSRRDLLVFGLLAGLTVLARVDGVLFMVALAADFLLRGKDRLPRRIKQGSLAAAAALGILSPYLAFLWTRFGVLMPESGSAVRFLSLCYGTLFVLGPRAAFYFPPEQVPAIYYAGSLRKAAQVLLGEPLLFPSSLILYPAAALKLLTPRTVFLVLGAGLVLLGNLLLLFRIPPSREDAARRFACVVTTCAVLWVPAYAFGVLGQWWFSRYFFPLFLLMAAASGPVLDYLGGRPFLSRRASGPRLAASAAGLQLLLFATQVPGQFLAHKPYQNVSAYMEAGRALDRALPEGSRGGAFQSGTIGYFSRHPVVNLDGVVNRDAAVALKQMRMTDYIRSQRIEAIIDWPLWIDALLVRRSRPAQGSLEARNVGPFMLIRFSPVGEPERGAATDPKSRGSGQPPSGAD